MSDLYKSSMHARIAKLPDLSALHLDEEDEDEEEDELDEIGDLPSGLGPPAMSVLQLSHPPAMN
jgi:protein phosphatase methylesterase 1